MFRHLNQYQQLNYFSSKNNFLLLNLRMTEDKALMVQKYHFDTDNFWDKLIHLQRRNPAALNQMSDKDSVAKDN